MKFALTKKCCLNIHIYIYIYIYIYEGFVSCVVIDPPLMMAQSQAESTRDTYNYGQYIYIYIYTGTRSLLY